MSESDKFVIGDVVQFNENHKWTGCLGIVTEVKEYSGGDVRVMIGVPIPQSGTAYIYSMAPKEELELIGSAALVVNDEEADDWED